MSQIPGTYLQGGQEAWLTARRHGPLLPRRDPDTLSLLYTETLRVRASAYVPLALSSRGPFGTYLVEETEPRALGVAGLVEFQRIWARVPAPREEYGSYSHSYQGWIDGEFVEVENTVQSRVVHDYFHTLRPTVDIELPRRFRYVRVGNTIAQQGDPIPLGATEMLAEDATYERWRGNIYRRTRRFVPVFPEFTTL